MKRKYIDIEEAFSYDNLIIAERIAGAGKKGRRQQAITFRLGLETNIRSLQQRILSGNFVYDKGHSTIIYNQHKTRVIHTVNYEASIVDQAIINAIEATIHHRLIRRTYGCIKGRGGLRASQQLRKDMEHTNYFFEADIQKYYPTMDRKLLMYFIRRIFKGERFLCFVESVINSYHNETIVGREHDGISIGSRKSQTFGNLYCTLFDYFVLQKMKAHNYERLVDDMRLSFVNKHDAVRAATLCKTFVAEELHQTLHKMRIAPYGKQVTNFCMYQHRKDRQGNVYVLLKPELLIRFRRKLRYLTKKWHNQHFASLEEEMTYILKERSSICSYMGILKYCNSKHLVQQLKTQFYEIFRRINRCASCAHRRQNTMLAQSNAGA